MTTRVSGALAILLITVAAFAESSATPKRNAQIKITAVEGEQPLEYYFNPSEMSIDKGVDWDAKMDGAPDAPELEFTASEGTTIRFTTEFDRAAEKGNVYLQDVKPLDRLILVDPKLKRPPLLTFTWADRTFKGVIASLNVRYTMFSPEGTPVRASVTAAFREANQASTPRQCSPSQACSSGYECVDSDGDGFGRCVRR